MITINQYFGVWSSSQDVTGKVKQNAVELVARVNALLADIAIAGIESPINQKTKSQISGEVYGGFRPQDCPIGASSSSHKTGEGVDVFDPLGKIDAHIDRCPELLVKHNLYREHAKDTSTWCHLQTRKTKSGKRTFLP